MAQSGFTPLLIYGSTTPGNAPTAGNLTTSSDGVELAINAADGKLFYKDNLGVVQTLVDKNSTPAGGSTTQVQFNSAGFLAGSASLTWDGTTLTSTGFAGPLNGTVGAGTPASGAFTTLSASSTTTLSSLTASTALALNASQQIVSVTNTGTGNNVLATSPVLTTPNIGAATATSVNKLAITAPATAATLTIADGKTLTANNSLTLAGTDGTTMTFPNTSGTLVTLDLSQTLTNKTISVDDNTISGIAASSFVLSNASGNIDGAAAQKAIPTGAVVGTTDTQTLTNKKVTARVSSTASISSPLAWNSDNYDQYAATAQAAPLTINADAGTPTDGQKVVFRFKDDGTARALTWTTGVSNGFQAIGTTLPTTTVANKLTYVGAIYNSASSRWDVVAVTTEA